MEVIWDDKAFIAFNKILDYISKDSPKSASKIADKVIETFNKIAKHPFIYPADKYKRNNTNLYRAFNLYRIRISYKVEESRILVVRCRHTSQLPLYY
ncbi:MAG: type II toxin-antitoxin system RelE/ParE family toxin [Segetibacter sp.]|nr:type II toxin-antitoxin system RelE/ParE family toxin [Segetibacter sp.]